MKTKIRPTWPHGCKTDFLLIRLLTRRAECVCEHLSTLDSHDVRCVSHFSSCRGSRRWWRRGLRVSRRVLRLLTDTVSGRLRSTRRIVVIGTIWHWRRRLTTTTTTVVCTSAPYTNFTKPSSSSNYLTHSSANLRTSLQFPVGLHSAKKLVY